MKDELPINTSNISLKVYRSKKDYNIYIGIISSDGRAIKLTTGEARHFRDWLYESLEFAIKNVDCPTNVRDRFEALGTNGITMNNLFKDL